MKKKAKKPSHDQLIMQLLKKGDSEVITLIRRQFFLPIREIAELYVDDKNQLEQFTNRILVINLTQHQKNLRNLTSLRNHLLTQAMELAKEYAPESQKEMEKDILALQDIYQAAQKIPIKYRSVINLSLRGLSVEYISKHLNLKEEEIVTLSNQGTKKLLQYLKNKNLENAIITFEDIFSEKF